LLTHRYIPAAAGAKMCEVARSLVNSLSTVEIVLIFVVGSVGLAIAVALAIRRFVPDIAERQFEEIAEGLRIVYELLFALILAFVIASVLDKFSDAENTVGREATALAAMHRDNLAFPSADQEQLDAAIGAYITAVTQDEFETMSHGRQSPEAAAALETMYAQYAGFTPAERDATYYDQALEHLDEVSGARRERLALSTAELPAVLVIMLPIGVVLLLILEYRPRLAPRSQAAFMGTLALVLTSTYLLTIVLDYPFSGDVSVSDAPLTEGALVGLVGTDEREPQPGDRQIPLTAQDLDGVWNSDAYGTVVLRAEGDVVRGAYRIARGTVRGTVRKGVFRGVWCEGTREPSSSSDLTDAGLVEWKAIRTKDGDEIVVGTWSGDYRRKADGSFEPQGNWDLERLRLEQAADLQRRLDEDPAEWYCRAPRKR
jgi:hypothetical protein